MLDQILGIENYRETLDEAKIGPTVFYKEKLLDKIKNLDPVVCTALLTIQDSKKLGYFKKSNVFLTQSVCELYADNIKNKIIESKTTNQLGYAGIGSKKTPNHILEVMRKISKRLSELGYTLHSGGAIGADLAFEKGCFGNKYIFLPSLKNNSLRDRKQVFLPTNEALKIAEFVHPVGYYLHGYVKLLMGRNSHQVLGRDLHNPVKFVVCWTPDGCERAEDRTRETGGTGQAIALADLWGIPVFNLANGKSVMDRIAKIV